MFTKRTTEIRDDKVGATIAQIDSYHGPGVVVIRRLGWRRLEEAAKALMKDGLKDLRDLGGAAELKELQALAGDPEAVEAVRARVRDAKKADPLSAYDKRELCQMAIVTLDGLDKTPEAIDEFEPEVLEGTARAILRLARPGLFETEADEKNG